MTQGSAVRFEWHESAVVTDSSGSLGRRGYHDRSRFAAAAEETDFQQWLRSRRAPIDRFAGFFAALEAGREACMTASGPRAMTAPARDSGDLPVFRCLTSGSTGKPVEIRRTHLSWIETFRINAGLLGLSCQDRYGLLGDLSYSLSLYASMEAVHLGARLYLFSGLSPARQIAAMRRQGITVLYATPSQISLAHAVAHRNHQLRVPSLRLLLVGGSKLRNAHREAARALFPGAEIREFYGSSETSFVALGDTDTPGACVGKIYPGVSVKIISETGGNGGRICIRSPYTALGYAPRSSGSVRWQDGEVITADIGMLAPDGVLRILGRHDRRVKIADKFVSPEETETCILGLDGIKHAAVLPFGDHLRGASLVAFISQSGNDSQIDSIKTRCREQLDPAKRPKTIISVTDWPTLPSGKTDYGALRIWLQNERRAVMPELRISLRG